MQQYKVTKVKHHYELVITVKDYKLYMYGLLRHDIRWFPHKKSARSGALSSQKTPLFCHKEKAAQETRTAAVTFRSLALFFFLW